VGKLLRTGDVALRLKVSPTYVRQLADTGLLKATKTVGGYRLFDADEVERLAVAREGRQKAKGRSVGTRGRK
jgi:excisionase family DNA binding protein